MIKTVTKILIFIFYLVSFTDAQNSLIEINSAVDTSRITIGDRINYEIKIDYSDSLDIEHPGAGINLGQFEIKDYKIYDPIKENNRIIQKYEYTISVFDTGSFTIPPFPIAYFPKDSMQNYKIIEASAINIYVESILGEGEPQLKDIKPPIYIPFDYALLVSIVLIVLLILVGVYFGYRFYKSKKEQGLSILPKKPKKPAHVVALEAYQNLKDKDLAGKGLVKQYYTECSEILRKYLEERYFIIALEETTKEILRDMKSQDINKDQIETLKNILELSDLVKFAKHKTSQEEEKLIVEDCIHFVKETKLDFLADNRETDIELEVTQENV